MQDKMIYRANELLSNGSVEYVLGWKKGDFPCNPEPAFFRSESELNDFVYNRFCSANLSKYMIKASNEDGKTLVFLKPCDTYSFNQLLKEHRVDREKAYIIGISCEGNYKVEEMLEKELLERCRSCKGKEHKIYDELMEDENAEKLETVDRFKCVEDVEKLSPTERFEFWREELSKCIRCNACRNTCPACSCNKCVFDSNKFDTAQKVNVTAFDEQMFHIVRAYHVAGRCSDCGECTRVCPQGIKLHILNRKFIKDTNEFYGEFQAGAESDGSTPLTSFTYDDVEPSIINERG